MTIKLLIVDDEKDITEMFTDFFTDLGYVAESAGGAKEAAEKLKEKEYHIVVTDKNMPGLTDSFEGGIELVEHVKTNYPDTEVIMMTAYASIESAIKVMMLGAFDYIIKPFTLDELKNKIERLVEYRSFVAFDETLNSYKDFHKEILSLLSKAESISDDVRKDILKKIEAQMDRFFKTQKTREKIILDLRESLLNIAGFASCIQEGMEANDPNYPLIQKILDCSDNKI